MVRAVAITADGRRIVSGAWQGDGSVRLWDAATGRQLQVLRGSGQGVHGVAISADGKLALSGDADGTVRLWDLDTADELVRYEGHTAAVTAVAFSPDGKQILSAAGDASLRLWPMPGR
jgi:WD40 repeat protein